MELHNQLLRIFHLQQDKLHQLCHVCVGPFLSNTFINEGIEQVFCWDNWHYIPQRINLFEDLEMTLGRPWGIVWATVWLILQ